MKYSKCSASRGCSRSEKPKAGSSSSRSLQGVRGLIRKESAPRWNRWQCCALRAVILKDIGAANPKPARDACLRCGDTWVQCSYFSMVTAAATLHIGAALFAHHYAVTVGGRHITNYLLMEFCHVKRENIAAAGAH